MARCLCGKRNCHSTRERGFKPHLLSGSINPAEVSLSNTLKLKHDSRQDVDIHRFFETILNVHLQHFNFIHYCNAMSTVVQLKDTSSIWTKSKLSQQKKLLNLINEPYPKRSLKSVVLATAMLVARCLFRLLANLKIGKAADPWRDLRQAK